MFNIKPDNLVGDTNKLLYSILVELKQFNESVQSLRPIAKDVVVEPVVKPNQLAKKQKPKTPIKRGKKDANNS